MLAYSRGGCCCCVDLIEDFENGWNSRWINKTNWTIESGKAKSTVVGSPGTANGQSNLTLFSSNRSGYKYTVDIDCSGTAVFEIHGNHQVRLTGSLAQLWKYSGGWTKIRECSSSGPYTFEFQFNHALMLGSVTINGVTLWHIDPMDVQLWPSFYLHSGSWMTIDNVRIDLQGDVHRWQSLSDVVYKTCPRLMPGCGWIGLGESVQVAITAAQPQPFPPFGMGCPAATCNKRIGTFVLDKISDCVYEYGPHDFGTCPYYSAYSVDHIRLQPIVYVDIYGNPHYQVEIQFGFYNAGFWVGVNTWNSGDFNIYSICGTTALPTVAQLAGINSVDCYIGGVTITPL